jgi:3-isopropylmalate dehydrogenase
MKIAVLPGDGIGPEIVKQAVKVLKAINLEDCVEYGSVGGAGFEEFNDPLPKSTLDLAIAADAILLGGVLQ